MKISKLLLTLGFGLTGIVSASSLTLTQNCPKVQTTSHNKTMVQTNLTDFTIGGASTIDVIMGQRAFEKYVIASVDPIDATYNITWSINLHSQDDQDTISILPSIGELVIQKDLSHGTHLVDIVATDADSGNSKSMTVIINAIYADPANIILQNSDQLTQTIKTSPDTDQEIEYFVNISNSQYVDPNLVLIWSLDNSLGYFSISNHNNNGVLVIDKAVVPGVYNFEIICQVANYASVNSWPVSITVEQKRPTVVVINGPTEISTTYNQSGYAEYQIQVDEGSDNAPGDLTWTILGHPEGVKIDPHETNKSAATLTWDAKLTTEVHHLIIEVKWTDDQGQWKSQTLNVNLDVAKQDHLNMLWLLIIPIAMIIVLVVALIIRSRGKVNDLN